MQTTLNQHIEITPGVCNGRPRVAGTRIRIQNIVLWTEQGRSPDEIVANYPQLTLADVHAALAFYFDNRLELDRQIREDEQFVAEMKSQYAAGGSALAEGNSDDGDSLSSG
jgi:uncharacterized protein (DUF433 family)